MRAKKVIVAGLLLIVGVTALVEAQGRRGRRGGYYGIKRPDDITWNSDFTFCRLAYRRVDTAAHLRRAVDFLDRLEGGQASPPDAHDHG